MAANGDDALRSKRTEVERGGSDDVDIPAEPAPHATVEEASETTSEASEKKPSDKHPIPNDPEQDKQHKWSNWEIMRLQQMVADDADLVPEAKKTILDEMQKRYYPLPRTSETYWKWHGCAVGNMCCACKSCKEQWSDHYSDESYSDSDIE